jgi:hypothetical protein
MRNLARSRFDGAGQHGHRTDAGQAAGAQFMMAMTGTQSNVANRAYLHVFCRQFWLISVKIRNIDFAGPEWVAAVDGRRE